MVDISFRSGAAGEISPLLFGRTDWSQYAKTLRKADNFIISPRVPLRRRSGTQFISVLCRGAKSILIPFASSADDSLLVEISSADHGIRFIDQDGYQTESPFGAIAVLSISAHTYDGTGARKTPAYFKYEVVLKIAATSKQSEVENAVALGAKRAVILSGFPASLGLNGQVGRVTGMSSASGPARVMIALMTASRLITTEAVDSAGQVHPLKGTLKNTVFANSGLE